MTTMLMYHSPGFSPPPLHPPNEAHSYVEVPPRRSISPCRVKQPIARNWNNKWAAARDTTPSAAAGRTNNVAGASNVPNFQTVAASTPHASLNPSNGGTAPVGGPATRSGSESVPRPPPSMAGSGALSGRFSPQQQQQQQKAAPSLMDGSVHGSFSPISPPGQVQGYASLRSEQASTHVYPPSQTTGFTSLSPFAQQHQQQNQYQPSLHSQHMQLQLPNQQASLQSQHMQLQLQNQQPSLHSQHLQLQLQNLTQNQQASLQSQQPQQHQLVNQQASLHSQHMQLQQYQPPSQPQASLHSQHSQRALPATPAPAWLASPRKRPPVTPNVSQGFQESPGTLPSPRKDFAWRRLVAPDEPIFNTPLPHSQSVYSVRSAQSSLHDAASPHSPTPNAPSGGSYFEETQVPASDLRLASQIVRDVRRDFSQREQLEQGRPKSLSLSPRQVTAASSHASPPPPHQQPSEYRSTALSPELVITPVAEHAPQQSPSLAPNSPARIASASADGFARADSRGSLKNDGEPSDNPADVLVVRKEPGEGMGVVLEQMVVTTVAPDSPAERSGMRGFIGRKVTHFDREPVASSQEIARTKPNERGDVTFHFEPADPAARPPTPQKPRPQGSALRADPPLEIDPNRDPRNRLPFARVPQRVRAKWSFLDGKVLYFFDEVSKISRKGKHQKRWLFVNDHIVGMGMDNSRLTRSVPIADFIEIVIGDDNRVGLRVKETCDPAQKDMFMEFTGKPQRDRFVDLFKEVHPWKLRGLPDPSLKVTTQPKLLTDNFNLTKKIDKRPKEVSSTVISEVLAGARRNSARRASAG
ncbi:hypothetical protein DIPPA_02746 [Diplonema papillatum]|nr:hypothetical protein DIPPA_02746 [Diplonema papillatum]